MQELNRTLKVHNGDVQFLKFSAVDKLHKPLVAACKVVAAGNRIVLEPENQWWFLHRRCALKAQETNL